VNRQIRRLSLVSVALLVALIVATTYWQTWATAGLADRQDNAIQRVAQFTIKRGAIYASDGRTILAGSVPQKTAEQTLWFRFYPQKGLVAQTVGYSTQSRSQAGLERSENDFLTASNSNLDTVLRTTLDRIKGRTITGNSLVLGVDAHAQRVAMNALKGKCGAAVALDPSTGKVLVIASSPSYDPNAVESRFDSITRQTAPCSPGAPLLNRATQGLFTPGSTFKVITTAAALDSGKFTPTSSFYDPGYCVEYGQKVSNFADQGRVEVFGNVDLSQALQHSINAVFCQIGQRLGAKTILEYARRFGFYSLPPLETPAGERAASGLYDNGRLYSPRHPEYQVDPGRLAFGQERMLATPLQMAMVVGAVGNHGVLMRPYVVDRIVAPDGGIVARTKPHAIRQAIKPKTAAELTQMMEGVVTGGTGTAAQIPGIAVAGKTGTAETGIATKNTTWFVAFAPAQKPKVAVAVVLQDQTGVGGTTAAPIAKTILQALLPPRSNS
jgi:peptidoglycan glycosyltransferase